MRIHFVKWLVIFEYLEYIFIICFQLFKTLQTAFQNLTLSLDEEFYVFNHENVMYNEGGKGLFCFDFIKKGKEKDYNMTFDTCCNNFYGLTSFETVPEIIIIGSYYYYRQGIAIIYVSSNIFPRFVVSFSC